MPYPTKPKGGWQQPRQVVVNKSTAQLRESKATRKFMNKYHEVFQTSMAQGSNNPPGPFSLSGRRKNVCLAARRNAEEYSVEPSVRENAKRLSSRRNRSTENNNGQRPGSAYGDSTGVFAEGSGWPNAANEQSSNDGRISSQERSDQNTPDGIPGRREPEKQVSDVSLQTDTCDTLYVTKNTLTAYTIAIVQNAQALQYDQMHAALQTGRNQSSLETPLRAEELLTAHFN